MNESTLCFFTSTFPYGDGEAFIENEIKHISGFSDVIIIPVNATSEDKKKVRKISLENCKIVEINGDNINNKQIIKYSIFAILRKEFWRECKRAYKKKGLKGIYELLQFTVIGEHRISQAKKELKRVLSGNTDNCSVYSYWLHLPLYIALHCIKNPRIVVSRCHGFDLYETRNNGYLPYRDYFFRNATFIVPVSENGTNYLKKEYPQFGNKFICSRLGTTDHGLEYEHSSEYLNIVSCSRMVEIKRVERIVEALAMLSSEKIHWTHIGDGPLNGQIQTAIQTKLEGSNVCVSLLGTITNDSVVLQYAKNYYDCFINVSSTEGVPVSIMEAMSFGIPVIATDVGGTAEIVRNSYNGYLLNANFEIEDLAEKIKWFIDHKGTDEISIMRANSREIWNSKCNETMSYKGFMELFHYDE